MNKAEKIAEIDAKLAPLINRKRKALRNQEINLMLDLTQQINELKYQRNELTS